MPLRLSALVVVVLLAVAVPALSSPAAAAHEDCTITSQGPFLYAGSVFPLIEVTCSSVKRRIRVSVVLTRDGVEVASGWRDCKQADFCWLGTDQRVVDEPGDQVWCGTGTASIQNHSLPAVTRCESDPF